MARSCRSSRGRSSFPSRLQQSAHESAPTHRSFHPLQFPPFKSDGCSAGGIVPPCHSPGICGRHILLGCCQSRRSRGHSRPHAGGVFSNFLSSRWLDARFRSHGCCGRCGSVLLLFHPSAAAVSHSSRHSIVARIAGGPWFPATHSGSHILARYSAAFRRPAQFACQPSRAARARIVSSYLQRRGKGALVC